MPRFSKENFPRLLNIVDALHTIGAKYNATPGQVALAWVLAQGPDFIPIPGTRKVKVRWSPRENSEASIYPIRLGLVLGGESRRAEVHALC